MIVCCGLKQKSVTYICEPPDGFIFQQIDYLVWCKHCKRSVLQVTRLDLDNNVSYFRRTDDAAKKLFNKLRPSIIYKLKNSFSFASAHGSFWLGYNEYGRKKRCYSNLSSLMTVNESLPLPAKPLSCPVASLKKITSIEKRIDLKPIAPL